LVKRCRDLVVNIELHRFKNHVSLRVNHVSESVDQVATSVNFTPALIEQVCAPSSSNDDKVAEIINFKIAHNIDQFVLSQLCTILVLLNVENTVLIHLLLEILLTLITTNVVYNLADNTLGIC